jgi:DNA end-binding protein Ku
MARPYWSGQLQISLVSFGIELFTATNAASEISFHQIDRSTGERVHHLKVIDGSDPVEKSEIVKGYEYHPGKYVIVEPEEIEQLRIESKHTIEIAQFVSLDEIPLAAFEKPYFVVPADDQQAAAFAVVRKTLSKAKKAGIGEIVFGRREHLVAIAADDNTRGMMAYTLRYSEELRNEDEYFSRIPNESIDGKQLAMASDLIENYSQPFDHSAFKDDYEAALRKLVEAKVKKQPLPLEEKTRKTAKVINLMDALKQSLQAKKIKTSGPRPARGRAKTTLRKPPASVPAPQRKRKSA